MELPKDSVESAIRAFKPSTGYRVVSKTAAITKEERKAGVTGEPARSSWIYDYGVVVEFDPATHPEYGSMESKRRKDRIYFCMATPQCRAATKAKA